MNVLVLNCGSSSLKYRLIAMPGEKELASGEAQRVGPPTAEPGRVVHRGPAGETIHLAAMPTHAAAFDRVMQVLALEKAPAPDALGHRVVHGGSRFSAPTLVEPAMLRDLSELSPLAPLHNPPAVALAEACAERLPGLPQVAVFDTAFHATIPACASTYALPRFLREEVGIRKYGFHGTSHEFVAEEAARMLGRPMRELNAVSCHLGSGGASLCAIVGGQSVDNTMGYSPLQGLIMSTRCGDLDPALALALLDREGGDTDRARAGLNERSGVLGLSGASAEIRDVFRHMDEGGRMNLTAQTYLWRIRKYLGAYLATVGEAHAIVFTDSIGEGVPLVRWAACVGLEHFGVAMDVQANARAENLPVDVATAASAVRILVIRTNEELAIARRVYGLLAASAAAALSRN